MKRPNYLIIADTDEEEFEVNDISQIFNKIKRPQIREIHIHTDTRIREMHIHTDTRSILNTK